MTFWMENITSAKLKIPTENVSHFVGYCDQKHEVVSVLSLSTCEKHFGGEVGAQYEWALL